MSNESELPSVPDMRLELVPIPVSDVDRAKSFYQRIGFGNLHDTQVTDTMRVVQFTPPGSPCSIHFGKAVTTAVPGSVKNLYLVVSDIEAARGELIGRGADVSEAFHFTALGGPPVSGPAPDGRSYGTFATFSDPDGNSWLLQEIKTRLPGRGTNPDVAALTDLLRETEEHHGKYEPTAPKHHWSGWYAAYIVARERGRVPEDAAKDAARHMEGARQ